MQVTSQFLFVCHLTFSNPKHPFQTIKQVTVIPPQNTYLHKWGESLCPTTSNKFNIRLNGIQYKTEY